MTVLVIEAGSFDHGEEAVLIPGAFNQTALSPYYWDIVSEPQTGLGNRSFSVPIGKAVGGGSVGNSMVFLRSAKGDYDSWEELGATSFGYNTLLPYFQKSENFTPPDQAFAEKANISWDESIHGTSGPLQVSYPNYYYPGSGKRFFCRTNTNSVDIVPLTASIFSKLVEWSPRSRVECYYRHQ